MASRLISKSDLPIKSSNFFVSANEIKFLIDNKCFEISLAFSSPM